MLIYDYDEMVVQMEEKHFHQSMIEFFNMTGTKNENTES